MQKHFHKSFMDTSRLEIDFAESFKTRDKEAHRPWSKHSEGSSAHLKQTAVVEEPVEEKSTRKSRVRLCICSCAEPNCRGLPAPCSRTEHSALVASPRYACSSALQY